MGKIPPSAFYALVAAGAMFAYFGYLALRDLLKQQKAEKAAATAELDENDELWDSFPTPLPWSGRCVACGWECKMGNTTEGYFLAKTEKTAKVKVLSYHQAQIKNGACPPHTPTMDDITVYPANAPA